MKSKIIKPPVSIGIGGQIGAGKTTVAKELGRLYQKDGHYVKLIYADKIAWKLYKRSTNIYKSIVKLFGVSILNKNLEIDRKKLAKLVFKKKTNVMSLNRIIHPELLRQIKLELRKQNNYIKIVDAALLFFWGKKIPVSIRILVIAPIEQKIKNMKKRHYNQIEVKRIISKQIKESAMMSKADFIINNNATIYHLKSKVKELYQVLKKC